MVKAASKEAREKADFKESEKEGEVKSFAERCQAMNWYSFFNSIRKLKYDSFTIVTFWFSCTKVDKDDDFLRNSLWWKKNPHALISVVLVKQRNLSFYNWYPIRLEKKFTIITNYRLLLSWHCAQSLVMPILFCHFHKRIWRRSSHSK